MSTWAEEVRRRNDHLADVRKESGRDSASARGWERFVKQAEKMAKKEETQK